MIDTLPGKEHLLDKLHMVVQADVAGKPLVAY